MDCGCKIKTQQDASGTAFADVGIEYCPTHAAAPKLLDACEAALQRCIDNGFPNGDLARELEAAIAESRLTPDKTWYKNTEDLEEISVNRLEHERNQKALGVARELAKACLPAKGSSYALVPMNVLRLAREFLRLAGEKN